MKLYSLTTIGPAFTQRTRCVGVYTNVAQAMLDVLNNGFDIYEEGYYPLAVIESFESDCVYGLGEEIGQQFWFEWVETAVSKGYVEIPRPEFYKNVVGFGVG